MSENSIDLSWNHLRNVFPPGNLPQRPLPVAYHAQLFLDAFVSGIDCQTCFPVASGAVVITLTVIGAGGVVVQHKVKRLVSESALENTNGVLIVSSAEVDRAELTVGAGMVWIAWFTDF